MSGCDPKFGQFGAYLHIWFTMGSCPQGQISFFFEGHSVFLSTFAIENLISKKMIPHMPYLAMLKKSRYSSHLTWESMGIIIDSVCPTAAFAAFRLTPSTNLQNFRFTD